MKPALRYYGVRYLAKNVRDIEYTRSATNDQLLPACGSKYAQFKKNDVFKRVKIGLQSGTEVLFLGMPCEIAALYHFIGKTKNGLQLILSAMDIHPRRYIASYWLIAGKNI